MHAAPLPPRRIELLLIHNAVHVQILALPAHLFVFADPPHPSFVLEIALKVQVALAFIPFFVVIFIPPPFAPISPQRTRARAFALAFTHVALTDARVLQRLIVFNVRVGLRVDKPESE